MRRLSKQAKKSRRQSRQVSQNTGSRYRMTGYRTICGTWIGIQVIEYRIRELERKGMK